MSSQAMILSVYQSLPGQLCDADFARSIRDNCLPLRGQLRRREEYETRSQDLFRKIFAVQTICPNSFLCCGAAASTSLAIDNCLQHPTLIWTTNCIEQLQYKAEDMNLECANTLALEDPLVLTPNVQRNPVRTYPSLSTRDSQTHLL